MVKVGGVGGDTHTHTHTSHTSLPKMYCGDSHTLSLWCLYIVIVVPVHSHWLPVHCHCSTGTLMYSLAVPVHSHCSTGTLLYSLVPPCTLPVTLPCPCSLRQLRELCIELMPGHAAAGLVLTMQDMQVGGGEWGEAGAGGSCGCCAVQV